MVKTEVKIGKEKFILAEKNVNDAYVLMKLQKECKSEKGQLKILIANIASCFWAYYKSIPFWRVFHKIRYKKLSNRSYLESFLPLTYITLLSRGVEHLEKQALKKKINPI